MVKEKQNKESTETISTEDKVEISQIIDYFKYSHELKEDMKFIPDDFEVDDMEDIFDLHMSQDDFSTLVFLIWCRSYNRQMDIKRL